jgi:predicted GNAT family acetyltransferase
VAQGAAVLVMAVVAGPVGLLTGYLGFYLVHGAANVVHYGMVHRLVDADHRTTVLSASSLAARLGGAAGAAGLGALASSASLPVALAVAALVLAAAAPLYAVAGRGRGSDATEDVASVRDMTTDVRDVPERDRYEVTVDGESAGFAAYRDDGDVRVFVHTEVAPAFEGEGVGSALARAALDDVRASNRRLVAQCPFIRGYIERHPAYAGLVDRDASARLGVS